MEQQPPQWWVDLQKALAPALQPGQTRQCEKCKRWTNLTTCSCEALT